MRPVARALVGVAVVVANGRAYAESARPQPQMTPQTQTPATTTKKAAAKAAPKRQSPKTDTGTRAAGRASVDNGAQVLGAGDGAPRCKVAPTKGTPLFEARFSSGPKVVITRLYPSGTFTRAVLKEHKSACIEAAQLDEIRVALGEAPWRTTESPATCTAVSAETTQIYAAGALRFTSRTCNPLVLDKLSSYALDLIAQDIGPFGLDLANELVEGN